MNRFEKVAKAAQEFPGVFALRGWPSKDRFRVLKGKSYVNGSSKVQLVVQKDCGDMGWLDFSRGTPGELRTLVITLPKSQRENS